MNFNAPHIDYAALSPVIALTAAVCVVLLTAVFKPLRRDRAGVDPVDPGRDRRPADLAVGRPDRPRLRGAPPRRPGDLDLADRDLRRRLRRPALDPRAGRRAGRARASTTRCCSARCSAWSLLAQAQNLVSFFVAIETLSIPLYILCATDLLREKSLESGLKYLIVGSLGSATLLYGMAFLYGGSGSTDFARDLRRDRPRRAARRPAGPGRHRPGRRRARLQDLDRPLPPVDARRLRGRADADHRLHGGGDQGGGVRRLRPLLRRRAGRRGGRLAAGARGARRGLDRDRQRRRARPGLAEAPARLLRRRPGRLHPRRPGRRQRGGGRRARLLPRRLPLHEPRRLQRDRRARARDRLRRRHPRRARARRASGRCSPGR